MCDLFHEVAHELAERGNYDYNEKEEIVSYDFLKHVHTLPKDAEEIFR